MRRGRPAPWACLVGTVAWTWTFLGAAALTGRPWLAFPTVLLTLAGFLGPVAVPSLFIAAGRWEERLGAFWRRCLDPRTLPWRWYAVVVALVTAVVLGPAVLAPGAAVTVEPGPVVFLLVGLLAGAAEEPGWRGYNQEALQRRMPVLAASLVVGLFWAAWHLPMFLLEGTYQHGLGLLTPQFWAFQLALVAQAPIYAWLYNASGGVVFSAVAFHALSNIAGESVRVETVETVGLVATVALAAVLVATSWRWMRHRTRAAAAVSRPRDRP
jgi:membrane protease YdiL (CAAX protease family)